MCVWLPVLVPLVLCVCVAASASASGAMCVCGLCRFGHVFLWDSGSSVGEITGHSKFINSIDYRPVRPFRVVTAGEDNSVGWFEGPPFRFKNAFKVRGWSSQASGRRESEGKIV